MRIFLILLFPLTLLFSAVETPLTAVDGDHATVKDERLKPGMSGHIIRRLSPQRSAVIAQARVLSTTAGDTLLELSPFATLEQDSLPSGRWQPAPGDTAVLGFGYSQALLVAPDEMAYDAASKQYAGLEWVHPDRFAVHLSVKGHPTPLQRDFADFCAATSTGLLFVADAGQLFKLDCRSFALLEQTPLAYTPSETKLPFYSRVEEIDAAWFGEGSSELESYSPYYLELIVSNNRKNMALFEFIKRNVSDNAALLEAFDLKETK